MLNTTESPCPPLLEEPSNETSTTGSSRPPSSSSASTAPTPQKQQQQQQASTSRPTLATIATAAVAQVKLKKTVVAPAKKAPWRAPGNWQMPDIIKETWEKKKLAESIQPVKKKMEQPPSPLVTNRRPWIPVTRCPDIVPLPPPIHRSQKKPHAEFDAKLRKVLPRSKIMELNPRDYYIGLTKVGSGANGAVVRASKRGNKGQVAIKRCFIEDRDIPHHAYILRELRIMGCLSHPNLIELKEATLWGDHLWMAMELMSCSVFGLLYNTTVGLSEAMAIRIAKECLEGLVYLHSKNYMHRDIKCENILLGRSGQVKLADFGLATPLTKENSARLGTAKWMAPEVVSESPYKENVDIWSLAITMIEMMDRVPPLYYLEEPRDIYGEILYGNPPTFNFTVPSAGISELVMWMLNPQPEQRPDARTVLTKIKQNILSGALQCATQSALAAIVCDVFPE
ncbi:signal transducing kinase of the PAK [Apophysomyces ossiformis]|uniref:non-specific serine/threonine protein kinase n=1 Tax=Apophysomyces ossiformis TaxID=679940 RepID=A0A8H7BKY6_9FUNG|nr:signal transducing kinase of the PAK [Apophysomyces ossiformis]